MPKKYFFSEDCRGKVLGTFTYTEEGEWVPCDNPPFEEDSVLEMRCYTRSHLNNAPVDILRAIGHIPEVDIIYFWIMP